MTRHSSIESNEQNALHAWEEFIEDDCGLNPNTARDYMRAARNLGEMAEEERSALIGLGLEAAIINLAGEVVVREHRKLSHPLPEMAFREIFSLVEEFKSAKPGRRMLGSSRSSVPLA